MSRDLHSTSSLEKLLNFSDLIFLIDLAASRFSAPYFALCLILCLAKNNMDNNNLSRTFMLLDTLVSISKYLQINNYET